VCGTTRAPNAETHATDDKQYEEENKRWPEGFKFAILVAALRPPVVTRTTALAVVFESTMKIARVSVRFEIK